ncbi:BCCT family transporter [Shimia abyssi]|nr:BCCT family transporter [Shimia abyssi]
MLFANFEVMPGYTLLKTIASGGSLQAVIRHRMTWGILLALVIGTMLVAGNTGAEDPRRVLRNAMMIGTLPHCRVMILKCITLTKPLKRGTLRGQIIESDQPPE